ncbi:phospholipase A2 group XV-like [Amphibalanus amphitrite]|uniref:phospholipase A2 group XV-like n=1 Tax=Amphibalanus amphitrite TaxID=1232801 RepID=UPI001C91ACCA|nr:phospholipase A2 group XV-like [Amphibalanus amphitrite]XP_043213407.1 phospholipase A2 group XV-like [Amphibalanus amphitrite]XP_043213415.1 phospholipase A2 group XV-like [Amphibalanus amphitrite]XP_043213424.1 phospholipase A2 group XV-like [Amphibalanus amphitrite]XP_043213433.1 phospholipase A2 group XV-like [Amphibalanus amphitrite]
MRIFHGIIVFGLIWTTSATPLTFGKFYGNKGKAPTRHPVILVPGDGGSKMMAKLNKTSGPHYWCYQHTSFYLLWLNLDVLFSKFMDCFVDNMKLTYNITDRKTYNTPGVETVVPGFGTTDTIENLSDWNSIFFSYTQYFYHIVENMVTQLNYTRNVDVVGAPYDFRKAPNELGVFLANLTRLTEQVYYRNANRRVVLVTHSYGCPLTLHWLHSRPQAWKDKFIEQWVSLAGPFAGTALSYEVYAAGYNLNVWELSGSRLRQEQRTSPSLAFLSPSPQAWPKDYVFLSTPETNYTLQNVQQFFTDINYTVGWEMRKDTAGLLDITQPPGVSMYCVYGNGSATTERVVYTDMAKFPDSPDHVVKGAGDGTVNLRSLQWCESWRGRQRQPLASRLYPDADHMGMITKPAMAAEIVNHLAALNGGQLV